jgi:hypothetical protein
MSVCPLLEPVAVVVAAEAKHPYKAMEVTQALPAAAPVREAVLAAATVAVVAAAKAQHPLSVLALQAQAVMEAVRVTEMALQSCRLLRVLLHRRLLRVLVAQTDTKCTGDFAIK